MELKTKNIDVRMLCDNIKVFHDELGKSASSGVFNYDSDDLARLETYINRIEFALNFVSGSPKLDLPKSHPKEYQLRELAAYEETESPNLRYMLAAVESMYLEIASGQSSDLSNSLELADQNRVAKLVQRSRDFVQFVKDSEQIDAPEMANTNA